MQSTKLTPQCQLPEIITPSLSGEAIMLSERKNDDSWKLIVVYRGLHCPICAKYLSTLHGLKDKLDELKVETVVVSADPLEKVKEQFEDFDPSFKVGYDLSIEQMRDLGLYISSPRSPEETDRPFAEPGLFVVNHKNELHIIDISNAPFSRPDLNGIVDGIQFIRNPENDYPVRGTYAK